MNMCGVSSKIYNGTKCSIGIIAAGIAIYSYLISELLQAIFLTLVFLFTVGDVIKNWSAYKLLDVEMAQVKQHNDDYKRENSAYHKENKHMKQNVDNLSKENSAYHKENKHMKQNISNLSKENDALSINVDNLNQASDEFSNHILNLNDSNLKLSGDLEELEKQVLQLKQIQINSRKLINSLMAAGDDYKEFNKIFEKNVNQLQNTEQMLEALVNGLRDDTFMEMDEDHDGIVTPEEYNRYLAQKKSHK